MSGILKEPFSPIREYMYEIICGTSERNNFPKSFELDRSELGTIKNQGKNWACVAEVIAQIVETFYKKEMSEGYNYAKFRSDSFNGPGLYVSTALKICKSLGNVPKELFDILVEMPELKEIVDKIPELDKYAKQYPISGYVSLSYADKQRKDSCIKDALSRQASGELKGYGLLVVSSSYFGQSHCIMLTGWDDDKDTYTIKNSYGKSYGDNGFKAIPKNAIDEVYLIMFDEITLPFTDVSPEAWYYNAVKNMYCSGLMRGTTENTFEPDKPITRAEMATLCNRMLGLIDERFTIQNKLINEKVNL